jgi:hypothetical protein
MLPKQTSETSIELDPNELTFITTQPIVYMIKPDITNLTTVYPAHTLQYQREY